MFGANRTPFSGGASNTPFNTSARHCVFPFFTPSLLCAGTPFGNKPVGTAFGQQQTATPAAGGLFGGGGATTSTAGTGLFGALAFRLLMENDMRFSGQTSQQQTSLFGTTTAATTAGSSLFGNTAQKPGGLFGGTTATAGVSRCVYGFRTYSLFRVHFSAVALQQRQVQRALVEVYSAQQLRNRQLVVVCLAVAAQHCRLVGEKKTLEVIGPLVPFAQVQQ